jgi:hypothetical protein
MANLFKTRLGLLGGALGTIWPVFDLKQSVGSHEIGDSRCIFIMVNSAPPRTDSMGSLRTLHASPARSEHGTQWSAQSAHHALELREIERLRSVGKGALGAGMHLDDDGVRSDRNSGARDRADQALLAGAMRRIGHHRQMREFFGESDRGKVERVARAGFEGLDSALAKCDLIVPSRKQVFRRQQPLLHRGRGAALEQNRLLDGREPSQQREILHVARADLEHVGVLTDQVHVFGAHDLGYHREAGEFTSFAQNLQRFNSQSLELIRRGARFVGSAAQHGSAGALYAARGLQQLFARFHRAGTGDHDHFGAADLYAADVDHRALRPGLAADELEGLGDGDHVVHAGRDRKRLDFMTAPAAADGCDDGALGATRDVRLESGFADALNDVVDLLLR